MATLDFQARSALGKGSSRDLRRQGRIPAVLYGGGMTPFHFSVGGIAFERELHQKGFSSKIFEVPMDKKKEKALVRVVQFHPVTDRPLHVDFFRVKEGEKITLSVPVNFLNDEASPGIKKGGVLNILVHSLDIACDLSHIPDSVDIDLTGLEIHSTIHLTDIKLPAGVVALHPERDNSIATIVAPTVMKEEAAEEEAAEAEGEEAAGEAEGGESESAPEASEGEGE